MNFKGHVRMDKAATQYIWGFTQSSRSATDGWPIVDKNQSPTSAAPDT